MSNINDIHISTAKDFPDNIIIFLSGDINLDRLDEEVEMKKIAWVRIKDE